MLADDLTEETWQQTQDDSLLQLPWWPQDENRSVRQWDIKEATRVTGDDEISRSTKNSQS